jgi:uncharacterized membrane protein YeiH
LLLTIDLIDTFVFAWEGAMAAIENKLDLLGLLVLSFATALGGGIIRDLLIGQSRRVQSVTGDTQLWLFWVAWLYFSGISSSIKFQTLFWSFSMLLG